MADEVKDLPKLSDNAQKVIEMVEKMTVLELADLVKVMEDKFGVSAAAPMAVAAAPAAEAEEVVEKSVFNIVLKVQSLAFSFIGILFCRVTCPPYGAGCLK